MPEIKVIDRATARLFVEQHHYSKNLPSGKNLFFGVCVDESLYAVAVYGLSASMGMENALTKRFGKPVTKDNYLELRRLCRVGVSRPACGPPTAAIDGPPLTWFLARCHKQLKTQGYRFIVSFSDPMHDHNGGIYKAANFKDDGLTGRETHNKDKDGNVIHRRIPYQYKRRCGFGDGVEAMARARRELGLTKFTTPAKRRWLFEIR